MLKHLGVSDLVMIARNGASLEIDGTMFTTAELATIARNLTDGAFMKVSNVTQIPPSDLALIARNGRTVLA